MVKAWGDGTAVAADGTQVETYINNLLLASCGFHVAGQPGNVAKSSAQIC